VQRERTPHDQQNRPTDRDAQTAQRCNARRSDGRVWLAGSLHDHERWRFPCKETPDHGDQREGRRLAHLPDREIRYFRFIKAGFPETGNPAFSLLSGERGGWLRNAHRIVHSFPSTIAWRAAAFARGIAIEPHGYPSECLRRGLGGFSDTLAGEDKVVPPDGGEFLLALSWVFVRGLKNCHTFCLLLCLRLTQPIGMLAVAFTVVLFCLITSSENQCGALVMLLSSNRLLRLLRIRRSTRSVAAAAVDVNERALDRHAAGSNIDESSGANQ
jgi:hypothetical protein